MTTLTSVQAEEMNAVSYERMLRRGMAAACFLFTLLFLVVSLYDLTGSREFNQAITSWINSNDVQIFSYGWLAWYAGIPAMIGVAWLLKDKMPRLAFWATLFVFIGGMSQVSVNRVAFEQALLRQLGFEIYYNTPQAAAPPTFYWAITVMLWMIGLVLLGIGVWRTGVLPKWVGVLLALAGLAFFLYQGPGGIVPAIPPIALQATNFCFSLAFPMVGLRLWRG